MRIKKAVITAAKPDHRSLAFQRLVDRDGNERAALELILEEVSSAGIDEVCIVVCPDVEDVYKSAAAGLPQSIHFVSQPTPNGYGDAICQARDFVGNEPFLHLVGDHLYISKTDVSCAKQLVEVAEKEDCAVSAVQATRERRLSFFGAIGGTPHENRSDLYRVNNVLEKPTPTAAEQQLYVPGLRSGFYLCLFGMHVLTPQVLDILEDLLKQKQDQSVCLSDALQVLCEREQFLAMAVEGSRYNIGIKYGIFYAQLAHALNGRDRDEVLSELVSSLAIQ